MRAVVFEGAVFGDLTVVQRETDKVYKKGNRIAMWFIGEVLTLYAVWPFAIGFLLFNYVMNILFLIVILWYKLSKRDPYDKNQSRQ